jgi:threonine synthase
VAAAFHGKPGFEVLILFPEGKVSARQQKQLTAWGGNVHAFAVRGSFDDCQRIAKSAFADPWWKAHRSLVSANSINLGRLLPQAAYYAAASLWYQRKRGSTPTIIVPSGNLGNATGALWAKRTGLPIGKVVLATNSNRAVTQYFESGKWKAYPTVVTLANAMDVGDPSNMERISHLYPDLVSLRRDVDAVMVSDDDIRQAIVESQTRWNKTWCPHTATAAYAHHAYEGSPCILVATAHAAKFESIVEPLLKKKVEIPPALNALLSRPSQVKVIEPSLSALQSELD